MGLFTLNTKAANVGFGTITTGAVQGTFTQLPSQLCDEVVLTPGTASVQVAGAAGPGNANFITITAGAQPFAIKTGGNLSNIWVGPPSTSAITVGYQWVQYKPIT